MALERLRTGLGIRGGAVAGIFLIALLLPICTVRGDDAAPTATPRGSAIWLMPNASPSDFKYEGFILDEIFRQALLISARDELGLQTRDADLREWKASPPDPATVQLVLSKMQLEVHLAGDPNSKWLTVPVPKDKLRDHFITFTEMAEKLSRTKFRQMLVQQGWSGKPNTVKPDAPAPADAEAKLGDLQELSQFAIIRETHAAIRADGESPARLAVLVRGYADLGQLTRYHWSTEYAVYTARSLLYAQRLVAANPDSATALWVRAYARAMAGLQASAISDLTAADKKAQDDPPPAWVMLLKPYCKYQPGELVKLAGADESVRSLALYLAFLTAETSRCQGAIMNLAQAALAANPNCLRLIDTMCEYTGPGMRNDLTAGAPQIFSATLGAHIEDIPALGDPVKAAIAGARQAGGGLPQREAICQKMIEQGSPDLDANEPSLAALGRLIQETTFVHIQQRADMICNWWGVDASDYVEENRAVVAEHPFAFLVEAYGLVHREDADAVNQVLKRQSNVLSHITERCLTLYDFERELDSSAKSICMQIWWPMNQRRDLTSMDLESVANMNDYPAQEWFEGEMRTLKAVSADSPACVINDIRHHWDGSQADTWEKNHGDYPSIAMALGNKYAELKQWDNAERCYQKYIAVSPDLSGYQKLADFYKDQGHTDKWLATLKDYLKQTDYGLQHGRVQIELANYYIGRKDYAGAVEYADATAATGSGQGLECAAEVYTGLENWGQAESMIKEEMTHYSLSPREWYLWCMHTGHGDAAGAMRAVEDFCTRHADRLSDNDLLTFAALRWIGKRDGDALAMYQGRMQKAPGPLSGMHVAVVADEMDNEAVRDAALAQVAALATGDANIRALASILQDAVKSGPKAAPNRAAINAMLLSAKPEERVTICLLVARFLEHRGFTEQAITYLRPSPPGCEYRDDQVMIDVDRRALHLPAAGDEVPAGN